MSGAARSPAGKIRPMLASLDDVSLRDEHFIYEPKYDGIRALVEVRGKSAGGIRIWSRLGNDKTAQFPTLVKAFQRVADRIKAPVLLDGEIVALDPAGRHVGFQHLQRVGQTGQPVGFMAFDILKDGARDLRSLPWTARRARLDYVLGNGEPPALRVSDYATGDARDLYRQAFAEGWEGLIAKRADSPYRSGKRSADWRKLKLMRRQEFVVGGWTEPSSPGRPFFGALLIGIYDDGDLVYVGHTGTGAWSFVELRRVHQLMRKLETETCPFKKKPKTNERPHWIRPKLVAEVKFTEWTADGNLRHPIYLGLREDVDPKSICREPTPRLHTEAIRDLKPPAPARPASALLSRLEELERSKQDGVISLPDGNDLEVGNLHKVFWPDSGITKGELLRYYVQAADVLLPCVADRPLVMRRFPNGVAGKAFYQQRAPVDVPKGVRVETLPDDGVPSRLIGGSLVTLLYMAQLAVISQDPWFSRVRSLAFIDHVALDLDPMPGVGFARVLDVARWVHEELRRYDIPGFAKTSGATGLHIYIPLPPKTSYESGRLFAQILATMVARKHPKVATVERAVEARGKTVYVDYLQNLRGKTLTAAYSAKPSTFAGVSTPLMWEEVDRGVDPRDFTIRTMPQRMRAVGDLWEGVRHSKPADFQSVLRQLQR